jgi:hypothetical protein
VVLRIINVPVDPVVFASPHEVFWVPATFGEGGPPAFVSDGSSYYCQSPRRFIVDIKMATYSNTDPIGGDPNWPTGAMNVWGGSWDVPGSWYVGGLPPVPQVALEDDVDRFELFWSVYLKHGDGPMTVKAKDHLTGGEWHGEEDPPFGWLRAGIQQVKKSDEGWDTWRFAVACLMRGVPQRVAVGFAGLPPE